MTASIITIKNGSATDKPDGVIDVTTQYFTTLIDSIGSSSDTFINSSLAGKYVLATGLLAGLGGWFFGQRSGAEKERKGEKLMFETQKSYEARLALTDRKVAAM